MRIVLGSVLLGFFLVFSAHAYALDIDATANLDTNVNAESATVDLSVGAGASTSGQVSNGDNTATTGSGGEVSGETALESGVGTGSLIVTRADAASSETGTVTVSSPASVSTSADLSAYASTVVRNDEHVSSVELSDTAVSLSYKVRARLFGIFPVLMSATAKVNANGETEIAYPWYAFLATIDSASLESDVKAATSATVSANANATLSAGTQARLLDEMHTAVKNNLEATLAAEASVE